MTPKVLQIQGGESSCSDHEEEALEEEAGRKLVNFLSWGAQVHFCPGWVRQVSYLVGFSVRASGVLLLLYHGLLAASHRMRWLL